VQGSSAGYAELATRADAGDRDAAVALVDRLRPCARRVMLDNEAVHMEAMLDEDSPALRHFAQHPKALDALAKHAESARTASREADEACEGMTPEQVLARGHWLYRAAELGDAKSALEFGRGDFLRYEPLTHLDEVAFWRDHAESMLRRALEGGERDALALLASGYDPSREQLLEGPRFAPDPVTAYAYYSVWSLSSDRIDVEVEGALARIDRELSDPDRARARAGGRDLRERSAARLRSRRARRSLTRPRLNARRAAPTLRPAPLGSSRPPRNAAGRASTHLATTPWRARRLRPARPLVHAHRAGLGRRAGTIASTHSQPPELSWKPCSSRRPPSRSPKSATRRNCCR
jgi:hypothetical protein